MSRNKKNNNQSIRNLIEKGEAYNRSMFSNKSSRNMKDDVTEQILFCQNGIENLNVSSKNINSTFVSRNRSFRIENRMRKNR